MMRMVHGPSRMDPRRESYEPTSMDERGGGKTDRARRVDASAASWHGVNSMVNTADKSKRRGKVACDAV